jgi:hypothetical protein
MKGHLTTDELIDRLYGMSVSEESDRAHLAACTDCRARWKAVEALRREMAAGEPVSAEFLAAQRRIIYSRLERPAPRRLRWLPALAAAGALAVVALRPSADLLRTAQISFSVPYCRPIVRGRLLGGSFGTSVISARGGLPGLPCRTGGAACPGEEQQNATLCIGRPRGSRGSGGGPPGRRRWRINRRHDFQQPHGECGAQWTQ